MPSILLSRSVAGTIHEPIGESDQGNGRHAAGFPIQCQPGVLPINHRRNRVTSHQAMSRPCHASRNQEDTEGHGRTRRPPKLSTGGHARNRQDTGGHDIRPVRDREAPGSNPGPPISSILNSANRTGFERLLSRAWP